MIGMNNTLIGSGAEIPDGANDNLALGAGGRTVIRIDEQGNLFLLGRQIPLDMVDRELMLQFHDYIRGLIGEVEKDGER